ncbi:MAG: TlpA family protein disulfide reductase [Egibacteraceae bacterium]
MRIASSPDRRSSTADRRPVRPGAVVLARTIAIPAAACAGPGADDEVSSQDVGPPAVDAAEGPDIPDVALTTFEGDATDLHSFVGTPLVVNFWASWCPPCAAEMPDFQAVSQQLGDAVRFVGVNTSDAADLADDLAQRTGVTYDLLRDPDGRAFQAFGGFGMPTTAFVAADGTVQRTHTGFLTRDALAAEIERWLGVEVPS